MLERLLLRDLETLIFSLVDFEEFEFIEFGLYRHYLPLIFRKAGRVWYCGARETREPHVTIG